MALVVLLRGVNLGKKRFSPLALAEALSDVEATSLGAAGTFIVRGKATPAALRARISAWLPFEAAILFLTEEEARAAFAAGERVAVVDGARRFATVMDRAPAAAPPLPLDAPAAGPWAVRVATLEGRVALGLRRRVDETGLYPNEVVEKAFRVKATTRDWPTVGRIVAALDE